MPFFPGVPRSYPHNINFLGHSYLNTSVGIVTQQYRIDSYVRSYLDIQAGMTTNRALSGATLTADNPGNAGYCTVLQQIPKFQRSATLTSGGSYPAQGGVFVCVWGINDLGKYVPSGDTGTVMTQIRGAYKHALRAVISRCRASSVHEAGTTESGQWAFGAGFVSVANLTSNSGAGYRNATTTTAATATFTIPADFPGGTISIGIIPAAGTFGGTITWSGTASQGTSGTTSTSNIMPVAQGQHGHMVKRITGLVAADAGKTIIATVTALDASGAVGIDYAQIEATVPNLVVVANVARLRDNAAYASYGNYWGNTGTPGSTGDGDVGNLNTDIASVVAEFDAAVVIADIDGAFGKNAANYAVDGIHPNEIGAPQVALAIVNAINTAAVPFTGLTTDFPSGAAIRQPRASGQIYTTPAFTGLSSQASAPGNITLNTTGTMYAVPFWVSGGNVVKGEDRFQNYVYAITTAGTGSTIRLGIYDDENYTHQPACLIEECSGGPFASTATGSFFRTTNRPLDFGLYWLAIKCEAAGSVNAAFVAMAGAMGGMLVNFGGTLLPATGWAVTGTAGALPQYWPSGSSLQGSCPLVALQAS